jgi:hypothetical protein
MKQANQVGGFACDFAVGRDPGIKSCKKLDASARPREQEWQPKLGR